MSRRRRGLSPEDKALWEHIARQTTPLHPRKPDPKPTSPPKLPDPKPQPAHKAPELPAFRLGEKAGKRVNGHSLAPSIPEQLGAQPLAMDRKAYNRMRRGKLAVDARIDLHGLTLADAHPRLNRFILGAHARGDRLVLVITGKGKRKADDGPIPQRKGVLRHQVPQWLRHPALASVVLQVTEAHQSHGGSGAYYVYLRRRR